MYLSTKEVKQKACPYCFSGNTLVLAVCVAEKCMAWQWVAGKGGYCKLIHPGEKEGKYRKEGE